MSTAPELFDETQTAAMLHVSRAWLAKEARGRQVPFVKLGNRRWYTPEQIADIITAATSAPSDISLSARRRRSQRAAGWDGQPGP